MKFTHENWQPIFFPRPRTKLFMQH